MARRLLASVLLLCAAQSVLLQTVPTVFAGGQKVVQLRFTGAAPNYVAFAITAAGQLLRGAGDPLAWTQLTFAPNVSFGGILYTDGSNSTNVLFGASWGLPDVPPSVPMRLFATSTGGPSSSDYYELQLPAGSWGAIGARPHPLNPDVLALFMTQTPASVGCQPANILALPAACIKNDILVTTDYGRSGLSSWTSVLAASGYGGFVDLAWSPGIADANDLSLLVTAYENEDARLRGWYYNSYWDPALNFKVNTNARIGASDNFRRFNSSEASCGNTFTVAADGKVLLSRSADCNGTHTGPRTGAGLDAVMEVLDSSLPREQWAWKLACFPISESSRYFNIFDVGLDGSSSDRQLFVLVDKAVDDPLIDAMPVGILYAADTATGTSFTLSLPWVLRMDDPISHLSTGGDALSNPTIVGLEALPAVIFAVTVDVLNLALDPAYLRRDTSALDALATRVSRDGGATWLPLVGAGLPGCNAASVDDACQLHLHSPMMATRDGSGLHFTGIYSSVTAPNIVIGTGNTGKYLTLFPNATSTFLSLDAGMHWTKIASTSQTYEIAANGGLLLRADDKGNGPVGCVYYSSVFSALDRSESWTCAQLSPPAARITSMQARLGSKHVVVYGVSAAGDTLIYSLDFKQPGPGLPALPACAQADLQPFDSQACRFGKNSQFLTRKPSSGCVPPPPPPPTFLPCGCGPADAVCGWGFYALNTSAGQSPLCYPLDAATFNAQPGCPAQSAAALVPNPNNHCAAPPPASNPSKDVTLLVGGVVGTIVGLAAVGVLVLAARKGWLRTCVRRHKVAAPRQLSADDEEWILQGSGGDGSGSYAPPPMPSLAVF